MKIKILLITAVLSVLLSACVQSRQKTVESVEHKQADEAPIHFIDDDGVEIKLYKTAERIIPFYTAHSQNLFDIDADDLIIGIYKGINQPEADGLPKYDYNGDPESVIAANPDVVLIWPTLRRREPDFVSALENAGITVISLYPDKFEEFADYITKLGLITGKEENAAAKLEQFYLKLNEVKKNADTSQRKIFFEATAENMRTIAPQSFPAIAIEYAGGINIASDAEPVRQGSSICVYGEERLLMAADDIDVYIAQSGPMNTDISVEAIKNRPGFDAIKAIKNGNIYICSEQAISSPTFRFADEVQKLADYLKELPAE